MKIIGVPKEVKADEFRVSITPSGVKELTNAGHNVLIETDAGNGSGFSNHDYVGAGARIVSDEDVWSESDLVVKVKEPVEIEYHSKYAAASTTHSVGRMGAYTRHSGLRFSSDSRHNSAPNEDLGALLSQALTMFVGAEDCPSR